MSINSGYTPAPVTTPLLSGQSLVEIFKAAANNPQLLQDGGQLSQTWIQWCRLIDLIIGGLSGGAGGIDKEVIYNKAGTLTGDTNFEWDYTNQVLTIISGPSGHYTNTIGWDGTEAFSISLVSIGSVIADAISIASLNPSGFNVWRLASDLANGGTLGLSDGSGAGGFDGTGAKILGAGDTGLLKLVNLLISAIAGGQNPPAVRFMTTDTSGNAVLCPVQFTGVGAGGAPVFGDAIGFDGSAWVIAGNLQFCSVDKAGWITVGSPGVYVNGGLVTPTNLDAKETKVGVTSKNVMFRKNIQLTIPGATFSVAIDLGYPMVAAGAFSTFSGGVSVAVQTPGGPVSAIAQLSQSAGGAGQVVVYMPLFAAFPTGVTYIMLNGVYETT